MQTDDTPSGTATGRPRTADLVGSRGLRARRILKRFLYSQMALRSAVLIALGREQPLVGFTVEDDPPSVYLVFRIRAHRVEGLAGELGLPSELELAPIRVLPGDDPAHLLTLNIYRVSGITDGLRAEWSVYVTDGDAPGTPRYCVVDARSSTTSMDPVDMITSKSTVEHRREGRHVRSVVGDGADAFRSVLTLPEGPADAIARVRTAPEWASANDLIYWRNGVRDRTYYDAGMADARVWRLEADAVDIDDGSPWAGLVEPEPAHVLVYCDAIELIVSPWENVASHRA